MAIEDVRPAWTIEKLDGKKDHIVYSYEKGKRIEKNIPRPKGWLLKTARHSCIIDRQEDIIRLGLDKPPPLYDDKGEIDEKMIDQVVSRVMSLIGVSQASVMEATKQKE